MSNDTLRPVARAAGLSCGDRVSTVWRLKKKATLVSTAHARWIAILQSKTMLKQRGRFIPILALATAGCLWGTGFFFGKIALAEMPVAPMVLYRFAFACVGLLPFIFF
jgi:hypothetical protein